MEVDNVNFSMGYAQAEQAVSTHQQRAFSEQREVKDASKTSVAKTAPANLMPTADDDSKTAKKDAEISDSLLQRAIEDSNAKLAIHSRRLEVSVHEKTHRVMVKVINSETQEVIREIPPESALDTFSKVMELAGLMVDKKR